MEECRGCGQKVSRYTIQLTKNGDSAITCLKCSREPMGYQPFKAYWDMNIAEKSVFIESDRQRERLMREQGLEVRPREHLDDLNHRRWTKGLPPVRK